MPFQSFIQTFSVAPFHFHHVLGSIPEKCCFPFCHYHVRLPAGRACPTSLFLFSFCLSLELHERGITRQTRLAGFLRALYVSLLGQDTRQIAVPMAFFAPTQRNSRTAPISSMSGNLRLLRGHRLATNSCNSSTSIPPTSSASLTSQSCSSTHHQGHPSHPDWGSPFPTGHCHPSQVSAPFMS